MRPAIILIVGDSDDAGEFVGPFPSERAAYAWVQDNKSRIIAEPGERYLYIETLLDPDTR